MAKINLKGKKILVTAGPVWVPIDKVRVITNIFGGALGSIIAKKAAEAGASTKLLLGPGRVFFNKKIRGLEVIRFKYFSEIMELVKTEVKNEKYDIVIQSAAISDYCPAKVDSGKIKSGQKSLTIKLKPLPKIVDMIKKIDPKVFLVKFKLEVNKSEKELVGIAKDSMKSSRADLIVANDFSTVSKNHQAFIINKKDEIKMVKGKEKIAEQILLAIEKDVRARNK